MEDRLVDRPFRVIRRAYRERASRRHRRRRPAIFIDELDRAVPDFTRATAMALKIHRLTGQRLDVDVAQVPLRNLGCRPVRADASLFYPKDLRAQPADEVLPAHARRAQATPSRAFEMGRVRVSGGTDHGADSGRR